MRPAYKAVAYTWTAIANKLSKYWLTSQKDTLPQHFNKTLGSNGIQYETINRH